MTKFQYHLPLYRQHQRIQNAGVTLSRATLTNISKRAIELLRPITQAQLDNVLRSKVLAMDGTPIKAGKSGKPNAARGKMKQAWFWPLYGNQHEVVFTYSASRGRQHIERTLKSQFEGTLLSDGYAAYARYAEHVGIIQSLISTCKLHGINPYTYLTDVLLRISEHPASRVEELTPRVWKETFADDPLRSDLYRVVNYAVE